MAEQIPGINLLVAQGGTAIIDQLDATLTATPELAEAVTKNTNFVNRLPGDQDWTISFEGQIPDDTGANALVNGNAGLQVEVDITDDNTDNPQLERVEAIQSLTLSLDQELSEVPPGINQPVGWNGYTPLRQDWEAEVESHYEDPSGDTDGEAVYQEIHKARENGNALTAKLSVLGVDFDGSIVADEFELAAGTDDPATQTLPFMGSGALTKTSAFESTVDALLSLYFNQNTATMALRHEEGGSVVTGSTKWEGSAYISTIEITLERDSFPTISAELQGDGALSRTTA
jgi:hypothetical protein